MVLALCLDWKVRCWWKLLLLLLFLENSQVSHACRQICQVCFSLIDVINQSNGIQWNINFNKSWTNQSTVERGKVFMFRIKNFDTLLNFANRARNFTFLLSSHMWVAYFEHVEAIAYFWSLRELIVKRARDIKFQIYSQADWNVCRNAATFGKIQLPVVNIKFHEFPLAHTRRFKFTRSSLKFNFKFKH
jgi:hypothetical protein